ncbi:unnamed protein product [Paramecium sonneborni]|uniref:Uncharacterized protein n=1 Tax=Paramecium sonneborni TaxID=65129 RepID=A0A8S1NH76_9CILI|nr:unnamed protein product [Paramecium sonneborni]
MLNILKNTLIIYLGLLGLSLISILVICLDSEYESHCPQMAIKIMKSISNLQIVDEVKMAIIPIIKELPIKWIKPLVMSSLMMALAFVISLLYNMIKVAYSLIMSVFCVILIIVLISLSLGIGMNSLDIQKIAQQYLEQIKLLNQ